MKNIILKYTTSIVDFMEHLKLSGATWSHRPIQLDDGEWGVELYDILTADELADMDLENMAVEKLKALLPQIRDLYENVEATLDEYDEELDMTKEAFDELYDRLEENSI